MKDQGITLQQMRTIYSSDPETERVHNKLIDEMLLNFPGLSRSTVENVLIQNEWNEINAIVPLFGIYEEHQRKEQEKKQVQELTMKQLELINEEFTEEDFKQTLEENDGDREATITQMISKVNARQAQKRKEQELLNRQYENEKAILTLHQRFSDVSKEDIVETLKKNNWDLVTAGKEILKISEQKKITLLIKLHPSSSRLEIEEALESANWEFGEACNILIKKMPVIPKNKLEESIKRGEKLIQQIQTEISKPSYQTLADSLVRRKLEAKLESPAFQPGQQQQIDPKSQIKLPFDRSPSFPGIEPKVQPQQPQPSPVPSSFEASAKGSNEVMSLNLNQTVFDINNEIVVQWKVKDESHNPSTDWIALYEASEENLQKYLVYQWIGSSEKQGFVIFTAPQQYAKYKFVCLNKAYRILAESPVISVGPVYEISAKYYEDSIMDVRNILVSFKKLSGNEHPNAWIGMYKPGTSKTQIHSYDWLSNAVNSTLKFVVPKGGLWEFKLFPERSFIGPYIEAAECSVTIPGKDTIILTHNGPQSVIEYDIQTLDPATDRVWIGVFFDSSTSSNDYRRSKNITSAKGRYTIKTPIHGGTYHARLYGHGSTTHIATSNSITVPDTSK
jgi:NACalpha-BTF3-like transcription factor